MREEIAIFDGIVKLLPDLAAKEICWVSQTTLYKILVYQIFSTFVPILWI